MKVNVISDARREFRIQVRYCKKEFGPLASRKLINRVSECLLLLADNPYMGIVDEELSYEKDIQIRTLFIPNQTKVVYVVRDACIYVLAFWNTYQGHDTIKNRLRQRIKH